MAGMIWLLPVALCWVATMVWGVRSLRQVRAVQAELEELKARFREEYPWLES